ncbi:MAG: hypothetical protein RL038_530 [Actinomycetota bacterium]
MNRKDIQILRGISVLAVVFYHADFLGFDHGYIGVDVFFVISGFLILGKIFRDLNAGKFSFTDFWGRRIRRLLPAASATILITLIGSTFFLSQPDLRIARQDAIFSSLNVVNWHYAQQNVDYWSIESVSPFLHFWSLSVEEQFYFVAPVFLCLLLLSVRSFANKRAITIVVFVGLAIASFLYMVTPQWNPSMLYFNAAFRIWEFLVGGIVAIASLQIQPVLSRVLKWTSLVGLYLVMTLEYEVVYPGSATLLPVFLTAIYLGTNDFAESRVRFTGFISKFWERIGDYSYSIYLWHWPITIFTASYLQGINLQISELSVVAKWFVVLLSIAIGWMSYRFIESPFRKTRIRTNEFPKLLVATATSIAIIFGTQNLVANADVRKVIPTPAEQVELFDAPVRDVANSDFSTIFQSLENSDLTPALNYEDLKPSLGKMITARAKIYFNGCHLEKSQTTYPETCVFGDPDSDVTVMLVGDSHAANWFAAVEKATESAGIKLLSRTKSSCGIFNMIARDDKEEFPDCLNWRENIKQEIAEVKPDLVIVSQLLSTIDYELKSATERRSYSEFKLRLVHQGLEELADIAPQVLYVHDIPKLSFEPSKCVRTFSPAECVSDRFRNEIDSTAWPSELPTNVSEVNFNDQICQPRICSTTNANYILYRDRHHLTANFSASLAPVWVQIFQRTFE